MMDHLSSEMPTVSSETEETIALANEFETAYQQMMRRYIRHEHLTPEEAHNKAVERISDEVQHRFLTAPPKQTTWGYLTKVAERNPEKAKSRWEFFKRAALEELQSGHWAAQALETGVFSTPWERARFLALRADLGRGWNPQTGIERALIDQMALAYSLFLHWLHQLTLRSELPCDSRDTPQEGEPKQTWTAPRMEEAEAIQQAAAMADRFQRMFLRTQRALRDVRRYTPPVIVQNAGQINVGGQQVNIASQTGADQSLPEPGHTE